MKSFVERLLKFLGMNSVRGIPGANRLVVAKECWQPSGLLSSRSKADQSESESFSTRSASFIYSALISHLSVLTLDEPFLPTILACTTFSYFMSSAHMSPPVGPI
jgi:hypothetical protein